MFRHLVAAWTFDDDSKLVDRTNRGHNVATADGNPTLEGNDSGALATRFDGTGDWYDVADHNDLDVGAESATFLVGVIPKALAIFTEILEKQDTNERYQLSVDNNGDAFFEGKAGGVGVGAVTAAPIITVGNYFHLAGIRDLGNTVSIGVNGAPPSGSAILADPNSSSWGNAIDMRIGAGTSGDFNGIIDYCYIFKTALTQAWVTSFAINPWQLFQPRTLFVPTEFVGNTSILVPTGPWY